MVVTSRRSAKEVNAGVGLVPLPPHAVDQDAAQDDQHQLGDHSRWPYTTAATTERVVQQRRASPAVEPAADKQPALAHCWMTEAEIDPSRSHMLDPRYLAGAGSSHHPTQVDPVFQMHWTAQMTMLCEVTSLLQRTTSQLMTATSTIIA